MDARWFQITALSLIITLGYLFFNLQISLLSSLLIILAAVLTQFLFCENPKCLNQYMSPIISALSIIILVRTDSIIWLLAASILAIASKFIFKFNSKHWFNPSNFAIVVLLLFNVIWVSPGQWGQLFVFILMASLIGAFITKQVKRLDLPVSFLIFFATLIVSRALYYGDPLSIAFHQLQSGSLFVFAFFMLSDPKPTPNSLIARILFSGAVAAITFIILFEFYNSAAVFYALFICSLTTPLLDFIFKGELFNWNTKSHKTVEAT